MQPLAAREKKSSTYVLLIQNRPMQLLSEGTVSVLMQITDSEWLSKCPGENTKKDLLFLGYETVAETINEFRADRVAFVMHLKSYEVSRKVWSAKY